jgi:hypothetical protein
VCNRRPLWIVALLAIGLSTACGAKGQQAASSPPPSSTGAGPGQAQRCSGLAQRNITPCPPDSLKVEQADIRNATNGAVTDQQARQWATSQLRTRAYYNWAMAGEASTFLTSGALADPSAALSNLFGTDLQQIATAKEQGGTLVFQPYTARSLVLVAVPPGLQQAMQAQQLTPKPYAFVVDLRGPAKRAIRTPDGKETVLASAEANESRPLLVWGEFKADPQLGSIWYEGGSYGCQDPQVAGVCQA